MDEPIQENVSLDVAGTVISILSDYKGLSAESISPSSTLEELGLTSLDAVTIAFEIEEAFDMSINESELFALKKVSDIIDRVEISQPHG